MKILLITDIHGDTENLEKILSGESYDAVLCAGDLSDANEFENYEEKLLEILQTMDDHGEMVKAVPGNMDHERICVKELIDFRMNIHKKIASFKQFDTVGFGGGKTPFGTPFEPEGTEIKNALEQLYERMSSDTRVGVIHQPPADTELDIVEGDHVGSSEVRQLIEEKDFDLIVTGHIHESAGIDSIGNTKLINPGPVLEGRYGVAEVTDTGIELEMKQI